jgi:hypothetical protein
MQERRTPVRRWLLPFTQDVNLPAIEAALRLAQMSDATLIGLSLIVTPPKRRVRLEYIQQSQDFLEALRHKARRLKVSCECYEAYTSDPLERITTLTYELACEELVLMSKGKHTLLLRPQETQPLLLHPPTSLVLVRLPTRSPQHFHLQFGQRWRSWWQRARVLVRTFIWEGKEISQN